MKVKKMVNLTPHPVVLLDESNSVILTIPPSGVQLRADETVADAGVLEFGEVAIPVVRKELASQFATQIDFEPDVAYIVSLPASMVLREQLKKIAEEKECIFLVPHDLVRDEKGNIIGCKKLGLAF